MREAYSHEVISHGFWPGSGPVLEPALILVGTVGGCWALHEFVIRRVRWLRPCFGLKFAPTTHVAAAPELPMASSRQP